MLFKRVLSLVTVIVAVLLYSFLERKLLPGSAAILRGTIAFTVFPICLYGYIKDRKELKRLQWMAGDISDGLSLSREEEGPIIGSVLAIPRGLGTEIGERRSPLGFEQDACLVLLAISQKKE